MTRAEFKSAILDRLAARAMEHPAGHQPSKGARFMLRRGDGGEVALMFEKNEGVPPNIWFADADLADPALRARSRRSPGAIVFAKAGKSGQADYGRHSALKTMPTLSHADLLIFTPQTLGDVDALLNALSA